MVCKTLAEQKKRKNEKNRIARLHITIARSGASRLTPGHAPFAAASNNLLKLTLALIKATLPSEARRASPRAAVTRRMSLARRRIDGESRPIRNGQILNPFERRRLPHRSNQIATSLRNDL